MPLYVHEVDARVSPAPPDAPAGPGHGMEPARFAALVEAVARELERRRRDAELLRAETRVGGPGDKGREW